MGGNAFVSSDADSVALSWGGVDFLIYNLVTSVGTGNNG